MAGNNAFESFAKNARNVMEAAADFAGIAQHALQFAAEELRGPTSEDDLNKAASKMLKSLDEKGLLDNHNLYSELYKDQPVVELSGYQQGKNGAQANIKGGAIVFEGRDYHNINVSKEGEFASMQWNHIGGKTTRFSDSNNDAIIIEPREGGYIVFDEVQNTVTVENAKGQKFKQKATVADKNFFNRVVEAEDFDLDWIKGSSFSIALAEEKK